MFFCVCSWGDVFLDETTCQQLKQQPKQKKPFEAGFIYVVIFYSGREKRLVSATIIKKS
ncbi:hypothetical protein PICMEDRAFT_95588 [Pichia membranifaciens NRRL Y-2026]|uniref:Uncharacterized protein n=1 Tax=Pichia membranifaciens NRRL Y-2026 TaxID=763406 RepID=A0A1E3NTV4_9ASCO|nr:hypothetical protein PICMEDRAFT_95588 [Pichia membranifaciens NRRL Y-2026]ODQ49108.1 hypothetical protein PICMEDRAFT_95588 [Pichia membranifaciens NRRL Y-2026]